MATIDSKVVFITTSPRTPAKMIPEIELLSTHFASCKWDVDSQTAFMEMLREENFFHGQGANDPAFSARDRINRAPKSLGFVVLSPRIQLTLAGVELLKARRKEEVFLRQLLKFQLPSPYHKPTKRAADFWVKPYLEIFRLVHHFGSLKFDELRLFGLQLTDYRNFDFIVAKIERFRREKEQNAGNYKKFYQDYIFNELTQIHSDRIRAGRTRTRETRDASTRTFLRTQSNNLRDYADACVRYLRSTGLVNVSYVGKSVSIVPEKIEEVEYFLANTERDPIFVHDLPNYVSYLGNPEIPRLLTDDRELLEQRIRTQFPKLKISRSLSLFQLKDIFADQLEKRKDKFLRDQVRAIKDNRLYNEINETFEQISDNSLYDTPLMLEWNTWRAMTMLDGGDIKANLKFDDFGNPMSTAQGNLPDIYCDYGNFGLTVEVTMQSGQRQYETEGEPITRHLAKVKKASNKPTYCLFIAPQINEACIAHFFALHNMNISYYGGTSTIVPLTLEVFRKMVDASHSARCTPEPEQIRQLFERSRELARDSANEIDWYNEITEEALNWLEEL
ncbi:MAG: AlwI family type II restriction endonuclease [Acidobacteria bacterium]|nr:AlwI family type II restriction endonuclease [Acidobacteriota bacterium]